MSPSILSNIRQNWRSLLGLAVVLAVGPMCGSGGGGGGGAPPGPTTFSVTLNFPAQNATGVARTQTIYLTVNGVVNPATLAGNISLIGINPIPVNLSVNALGQIEITPQAPNFMDSNGVHTVNVLAGVQTMSGATMVPKTFTFTTVTSTDVTAPTFGGATGTSNITTNTIRVSWGAGSDLPAPPGTLVANLVYDVYLATATGQVNFAAQPVATSAAGATFVDVTPLASNTTYVFVIRCRDAGGNRDTNTTERSGKTQVRFSVDIYNAIIDNPATGHCTICHTPGGQSAFMDLDVSASDTVVNKFVNVDSAAGTGPSPLPSCGAPGPVRKRVIAGDSANSLLFQKINPAPPCGVQMPEDGATAGYLTPAQIQTIKDWIDQGAPNN